jgi:hypothetical protein
MTDEPTVLDFVRSLLRGKPLPIPAAEQAPEPFLPEGLQPSSESPLPILPDTEGEAIPEAAPVPLPPISSSPDLQSEISHLKSPPLSIPWRALAALGLALLAQISLEPRPERTWVPGAVLYFLAAMWLIYANSKREWLAVALPQDDAPTPDFRVRASLLLPGILLFCAAFLTLGGNQFTTFNVTLWVLAILFLLATFWQGTLRLPRRRDEAAPRPPQRPPWKLKITVWGLVLLATTALVIFFRVYRLSHVPPEMVSDQAEKLLDVWDVLNGNTSIFFPRNTGREGFQMYLTAAVIRLLGTGLSFLSLKIGTVLCGLLTLPFIYGLGKEVGNRRVGLLAMLLAGIAYWPNVISRIGLRFTLYPFFTAPVMYFLVRGLRTRRRNDFILSGLFLGLGLHGYSPFRIVPILVVIGVVLYLLHRQSKGGREQAIWGLAVLVIISLVVFLPLLRFAASNPELFSYRALTRLGSIEQPLPGPAWQIFLKNLWNALIMFAWDNGEVWVVSVTHRPALDIISAALFHLGVVLTLVRYVRRRHWLDLFMLISIPVLLLPSILSLAFPNENPILNRTAGALVPVFVLAGLALDGLLAGLEAKNPASSSHSPLSPIPLSLTPSPIARLSVWALAILLVALSAALNYDLVFNQYQREYEQSAWNTSEMGQVIHDFGAIFGTTESAWVVAFPYWVDTRLVGMNAISGTASITTPPRDFAIWPEDFVDTLSVPPPKLFLIKPEDQAALDQLRQMYPEGILTVYQSRVSDDKNFLVYLVACANCPISSPAASQATATESP